MNPIQSLIEKQRKEFEEKFPNKLEHIKGAVHSPAKDDVRLFLSSCQEELIAEFRRMVEGKMLKNGDVVEYEKGENNFVGGYRKGQLALSDLLEELSKFK